MSLARAAVLESSIARWPRNTSGLLLSNTSRSLSNTPEEGGALVCRFSERHA